MKYVMGIVAVAAILAMAGCNEAQPSPDPDPPDPSPRWLTEEPLEGETTIVGQWFCASSTAEGALDNCTAFDGNMALEIRPDGTGSQLEVYRRP